MRTRIKSRLLPRLLGVGLGLLSIGGASAQTVTHIAAGGYAISIGGGFGPLLVSAHSLFSKSDGSLWVMGNNANGQLGIPGYTNVPMEILSNGVGLVAAGGYHSLFQVGHTLWAMGLNASGQLGDGTTNDVHSPEQVFATGFGYSLAPIAAGYAHSLFGTFRNSPLIGPAGFWAMGANQDGQLGDGTFSNTNMPEVIFSVSSGYAVLGAAAGYDHSLFIKSGGSLWAMGGNLYGQLGNGTSGTYTSGQEMIVSSGVTAVAAGLYLSFFIKSDGSLWAMGFGYGNTPFQVESSGVVAVAAGDLHCLFIKSDGSLWGMGENDWGELGDGTTTSRPPELIVASNVVAVATGTGHSLFIKSDGSLWGMGDNNFGELGIRNSAYSLVPVEIVPPPPPTITSISVSGASVVVSWPTNQGGFTLQSSPDLGATASWSIVSQGVIVGNQYVVTNPVLGPRKFFRLAE